MFCTTRAYDPSLIARESLFGDLRDGGASLGKRGTRVHTRWREQHMQGSCGRELGEDEGE